MGIGRKYAPLTAWLQGCGEDSVHLTFEELNRIITLPDHAYRERASWANLTKPMSFCFGWLNAGYVVDSITLPDRWVEFRRGAAPQSCNVRSLTALGRLYLGWQEEFEALRRYCSAREDYPAAKVIDMCFFEYGFRHDGGAE